MNSGTQKQTILFVDDEPINIDLMKRLLSRDYTFKEALNGRTALKILNNDQLPDIVLLDVRMDEMDGFEVCRRIKDNPVTKKIPVLFVTGMRTPEEEVLGFEMGAIDYITKPIVPSVLLSRIRTHLELKQVREQLEKQNEILSENNNLREKIKTINAQGWEKTFYTWPDIVVVTDKANRITECNQAAEFRAERAKKDIIGLTCHDALCRDEHTAEECELERMFRGGQLPEPKLVLPVWGGYYEVDIVSLEQDIDELFVRIIINIQIIFFNGQGYKLF